MLEQSIDIVRRAGDIVLSAHDIQNVTREKHGPADLVTQYDEAVQVFLRQELLKLLPEAEAAGVAGVSAGASAGDPSVVVFSAGLSAVPVRAEVGQISTYCEAT